MALTHRLTQPKPSAAPHLHFLTYKPGLIPAALLLSYIRQPGARAKPAALCNPSTVPASPTGHRWAPSSDARAWPLMPTRARAPTAHFLHPLRMLRAGCWLHLRVQPPWALSLLLAAGKGRRADGRVLFLARHPALSSPGECLRPAALVPQPASSTPKPSWAGLGNAPGMLGCWRLSGHPLGCAGLVCAASWGAAPAASCPSVVPVHGVAVPWGGAVPIKTPTEPLGIALHRCTPAVRLGRLSRGGEEDAGLWEGGRGGFEAGARWALSALCHWGKAKRAELGAPPGFCPVVPGPGSPCACPSSPPTHQCF